jgi:hypothetical protein
VANINDHDRQHSVLDAANQAVVSDSETPEAGKFARQGTREDARILRGNNTLAKKHSDPFLNGPVECS